MAKSLGDGEVRSFEDLLVWQKARSFAQLVYTCARSGQFSRDFGARDQACRAAVSVMSNIAEGFERTTKAQYLYFLEVAKASSGELRSMGYLLLDLGYVDEEISNEWVVKSREIGMMLAGLMKSIGASGHR